MTSMQQDEVADLSDFVQLSQATLSNKKYRMAALPHISCKKSHNASGWSFFRTTSVDTAFTHLLYNYNPCSGT